MPVRSRPSSDACANDHLRKRIKLESFEPFVPTESLSFATEPNADTLIAPAQSPSLVKVEPEVEESHESESPTRNEAGVPSHSTSSTLSSISRANETAGVTSRPQPPRLARDIADALFPSDAFPQERFADPDILSVFAQELRTSDMFGVSQDPVFKPSAVPESLVEFLIELHRLASQSSEIEEHCAPAEAQPRDWVKLDEVPAGEPCLATFLAPRQPRGESYDWHDFFVCAVVGDDLEDALEETQSFYSKTHEKVLDRRFFVAIAFFGTSFVICRFDAQGLFHSALYNIHTAKGTRTLMHFALGIAWLPDSFLGADDTMFYDRNTESGWIQVGPSPAQRYEIQKTLYVAGPNDDRATRVFRCLDVHGATVVVKDTWVQRARVDKEADLMRHAGEAGITRGILQLKGHWSVPDSASGSPEDSTKSFRETAWHLAPYPTANILLHGDRVHRRIAFTPHATRIEAAKDLSELLRATMDAVEAHEQLYERINVLHRDISPTNIMLGPELEPGGRRGGVLIDLDQAIDLTTPARSYSGHGTGTPGFMDPHMIRAKRGMLYQVQWDLTALFMVLLYWLHTIEGARRVRESTGLWERWSYACTTNGETDLDLTIIADEQMDIFQSEEKFVDFLEETSTEYTAPLWPLMLRLRKAVIDNHASLTHRIFFDILREETYKLPCSEAYRTSYPAPTLLRMDPRYVPEGASWKLAAAPPRAPLQPTQAAVVNATETAMPSQGPGPTYKFDNVHQAITAALSSSRYPVKEEEEI